MARFSLFSIAIFAFLAAIALSLPTQRESTQGLTLENAFSGLKTATKTLEGFGDKKDANEKEKEDNQAKKEALAAVKAVKGGDDNDSDKPAETKEEKENKPTRTEKKLSSGKFATPTATHTHHPSSQANALGKIPLIGGLLGGTGGPL